MNPGSPYTPGREIARGGMGAVLDTQDKKFQRAVAMKVMLRGTNEEGRRRFLQEARVLGQLAHPNIVPVHDLGVDGQGRLFYTMKLIRGVTLRAVLDRLKSGDKEMAAKFPLAQLLTIFQKVCDAIAFAHAHGVIHRDLKPDNIMVGEFGEVMVMDWGLAKILPGSQAFTALMVTEAISSVSVEATVDTSVETIAWSPADGRRSDESGGLAATKSLSPPVAGDSPEGAMQPLRAPVAAPGISPLGEQGGRRSDKAETPLAAAAAGPFSATHTSSVTMEGSVMGTPHFMSPEQARGAVKDIDARTDVFALGGVLYMILSLEKPVAGKDVNEVLDNVLAGRIMPPIRRQTAPLPHCPGGQVPEALSAVTMKAMETNPAGRYQSVASLQADLAAYQGGFATSAENASTLTQLRLFIHRHKVLTAAASLIVLLTIGFLLKVNAEKRAAQEAAARATEAERVAKTNETQAKIEADRAAKAEAVAVEKGEAARQSLAKAALNLAEAAQREGNGPEMHAALAQVPEDLRDSTHAYLLDQSDTSIGRIRNTGAQIERVVAHPQRPGVFAIADAEGKVTLVAARTGDQLLQFVPFRPNASRKVSRLALAFSPNGEFLAVGMAGENTVVIHSAKDGKKLREWKTPAGSISLEFNFDGSLLLQTDPVSKVFSIFSTSTGELRWKKDRHWGGVAFTQDGKGVISYEWRSVNGKDAHIMIWKAIDGSLVRDLGEYDLHRASAFIVGPNGKRLLVMDARSSSSDNYLARIKGISLESRGGVFEVRPAAGNVRKAAFSPDGSTFAVLTEVADGRQAIEMFDAETGEPLRQLLGGTGVIEDAAVHPLSGELVVAGKVSRVWDLTGTPAKWALPSIRFGSSIVFWGQDDLVLGDLAYEKGALLKLEPGIRSALWKSGIREPRADVSAEGRFALVGGIAQYPGDRQKVMLIEDPGAQVKEVAAFVPPDMLAKVRLSPDASRLAAIRWDAPQVSLLDSKTGQRLVVLQGQDEAAKYHDIVWQKDGQKLIGLATVKARRGEPGSEERAILWDATTGKIERSATNQTAMNVLAVAPDGRTFAEAGANKMVRIRDTMTLAVLREFRAHDDSITALAWHPSRPIMATASQDLSIKLWNLDTGRRIQEMRGMVSAPSSLAFSPTGKRLGCAGNHGPTRIWELASFDPSANPGSENDWTDLLAPLTTASVMQLQNRWTLANGALHVDYVSQNRLGEKMPLGTNVAGWSYQLRVKLRAWDGRKPPLAIDLPVGDRMMKFNLVDVNSVKQINLEPFAKNAAASQSFQGALAKGIQKHEIEITVQLEGANVQVIVMVDDQPVCEWQGPVKDIDANPRTFKFTYPGRIGVSAKSGWLIMDAKLKRLPAINP